MSDSSSFAFTGGCACGALRYTATAAPLTAVHCYCTACRRASGTGHSTHVVVPAARLTMTGSPATYERPADSGNLVALHFCGNCGSPLCNTGRANPQLVFLRASSLDDPDIVDPRAQVFTKDAAKWEPLDPALPSFPEMPPERARKAMAGRD